MITGRNIICIASNWGDHPTSKHHVMRCLAERNHVLWVNFHASRCPRLTGRDARLTLRRLRQVWAGPRQAAPHIDVLSPLVLPLPASPVARFINARVLARQIRRTLRRLPRRPVQLWLFAPDVPELIERLRAERVVYYCVDDFAAFSGYNTPLVEELERRTMRTSDVVITTSATLYKTRRAQHPCVHLVPHGVDFDHFAAAADLPADAVPADLRTIPRPIFGYMGVISDYVDLDLLARAARARPEWSFALLGDVRCDTRALSGLGNVHLLGGRPYEQLPAYCRGFDVGLIPFRLNRLTVAVNPIKLREYLAAGLPVVSAPLDEVQRYAPTVRSAQTLDEFLPACAAALRSASEGDRRTRQQLVRDEGWRSRVELLSDIVEHIRPTPAEEPALEPAVGQMPVARPHGARPAVIPCVSNLGGR